MKQRFQTTDLEEVTWDFRDGSDPYKQHMDQVDHFRYKIKSISLYKEYFPPSGPEFKEKKRLRGWGIPEEKKRAIFT